MIAETFSSSSFAMAGAQPLDPIRSAALQICTVVQRGDASLEHLLDRELRDDLHEEDKKFLYDICTGVFRWQAKLDWVLNGFYHGEYLKCLPQMKNALRIALYEIMFMPQEPADDAIVFAAGYIQLLKGGAGPEIATSVLTHISNSLDHIRYPDKREDLFRYAAVIGSHPWWIAKRWIERFGETEGIKLLLADNDPLPITFRINRLRGEVKPFLDLLDSRNIQYNPSEFNDTCIAIATIPRYAHLGIYKKGMFSPYSASCALGVALLAPQQNESIISICSAMSGKTFHIAEMIRNLGKITAVNRIDTAAGETRMEAERLGISIITPLTADPVSVESPIADRVLVDAPNSRIGFSSRFPVIKWKLSSDMLRHNSNYQLSLLANASHCVKPGGVMVYTTQSTEPEENSDVVKRFLDADKRFVVDPPGKLVPSTFVTKEGFVQTWPHLHRMEGSFAVRFVRKP